MVGWKKADDMKSIQNWIMRKISLSQFATRRDVVRFAVSRGAVTTVAAVGLNAAIYQLLQLFPIMEITVSSNPVADNVVTALVAGPISLIAYYLIGSAIRELSISRSEFERLSRTDPLTGLINRRALMSTVMASPSPYAIAIFDIDRFKLINDTYGHGVGDEVLIQVARLMEDAFGDLGAVARLGGEEFAVVLFGFDKTGAIAAVDAFRQSLALMPLWVEGRAIPVTTSAGITQCEGNLGYSALLTGADRALYVAKAGGRNRIVHSDELSTLAPVVEHREQLESRHA